jgi:hypothetical protein
MVGADESRFPDQGINGGGQCSCKCCALDECPYRKDPCQTHHAAVHACRLSGLCFVGFVYLTLIQRLTALELHCPRSGPGQVRANFADLEPEPQGPVR